MFGQLRSLMVAACVAVGAECGVSTVRAADDYVLGPDSQVVADVPKGTVTTGKWISTNVFPGTVRDYWIYVPAQYKPEAPACLMVFQDGGAYQNPTGQFRTTVVFDNLIHKGEMPVTLGVFISPGTIPPANEGGKPRQNRSFEYDSLGDQYARFLIDEFLPKVLEPYKLRQEPSARAICGISSGGICAFTAAWERPDYFGKVVSHIGSFTNIRGGHVYPALIRKTERKPLRVFLQEGSNDLDNVHGNWPLANREMAAALTFAKYDMRFEMGDGAHSGKHGGAILPETLKWLWRDVK